MTMLHVLEALPFHFTPQNVCLQADDYDVPRVTSCFDIQILVVITDTIWSSVVSVDFAVNISAPARWTLP